MGLTSGSLIALLVVVAVFLNAGTVWLWPQVAGSRLRRGLSRAALLATTQVGLALAVLVTLNSYFVFFSGWDELIGISSGNVGTAKPQSVQPKPKSSPTPQTAINTPKPNSSHPEQNGEIQHIEIRGASTGLVNEAYVMLPPQYFQPQYAAHKFPAVVMLTGYPGNPRSLLHVMHLPEMVHTAESTGKAQPMIYVLMRPTLVPPRDTECTDVPSGPQVESFFGNDVPRAITAGYRTTEKATGWAIMGDSTGGYCAAKIAMKHSDRYSAAVSLSGYFHSLEDVTTGDLYDKSQLLRNDNDLLWRVQHLPQPPISILVTSCLIGEKTYPQAKEFLSLAKLPLKADSLILDSGGHNFHTFSRMVPGALAWLSAHLHTGSAH